MQRCQSQGGVEETDHLQKHVCTPMGGCYPESIRLQASRQQLMGCDKCGMTSSSTGVTQCTVLSEIHLNGSAGMARGYDAAVGSKVGKLVLCREGT